MMMNKKNLQTKQKYDEEKSWIEKKAKFAPKLSINFKGLSRI